LSFQRTTPDRKDTDIAGTFFIQNNFNLIIFPKSQTSSIQPSSPSRRHRFQSANAASSFHPSDTEQLPQPLNSMQQLNFIDNSTQQGSPPRFKADAFITTTISVTHQTSPPFFLRGDHKNFNYMFWLSGAAWI
jgi:hypothetical protein